MLGFTLRCFAAGFRQFRSIALEAVRHSKTSSLAKNKKSLRGPKGSGGWLNRAPFYFFTVVAGAKESANAFAFGTPTPVTLSQPTFVLKLLGSVPSDRTKCSSSCSPAPRCLRGLRQ